MKYLRAGGNRLAPHCGLVGVYPLTMQRHSHARSPPYSALRTSGWTPTMQWHSEPRSDSHFALRTTWWTPTILLPQPGHGRLGPQPLTMQWHSDARTVPDSALRTNGCVPTTMQWHSDARTVPAPHCRQVGGHQRNVEGWECEKTPVDETGFSFVYGCLCVKLLGRR